MLHWSTVAVDLVMSTSGKPLNVDDESITAILVLSISWTHNALHKFGFFTFSALTWKNTEEDDEILLSEVWNCSS